MKIENVMTRRVVAARADTSLAHVARLMWDNDCGSVPVVDAEDKLVGILTDRDLCMNAQFSGRALQELLAAGCMASEVVACRPEESAVDAARRMGAKKVRRLPVTDGEGRLVGLVSVGDLLTAAARAKGAERKALQTALLEALTAITARPERDEVAPVPPPKKPGKKAAGGAPSKSVKPQKKRARV
jgi:CBS domain-containing protein